MLPDAEPGADCAAPPGSDDGADKAVTATSDRCVGNAGHLRRGHPQAIPGELARHLKARVRRGPAHPDRAGSAAALLGRDGRWACLTSRTTSTSETIRIGLTQAVRVLSRAAGNTGAEGPGVRDWFAELPRARRAVRPRPSIPVGTRGWQAERRTGSRAGCAVTDTSWLPSRRASSSRAPRGRCARVNLTGQGPGCRPRPADCAFELPVLPTLRTE
jgi:hypothetical protein